MLLGNIGSRVLFVCLWKVHKTLDYNSAGSNQLTTTYGDGLEEKRCRGQVKVHICGGSYKEFYVVKAMQWEECVGGCNVSFFLNHVVVACQNV